MISYRRSQRDGNHTAIVRRLREAGRSVLELHALGKGAPDILVGWGGNTMLMEIKNPDSVKGGHNKVVAKGQAAFRATWKGCKVLVVTSPEEALRATGIAA